ncbi:Ribophorin I [Rhizophagus irregularis]|uniref:Dolichyl-diphosphooligosaccharide--protein glycosyltransferase subunit 1 n=1 Tax=Rhizophagus irregularis TaxID=588596 RepID=A0A2I1H368_9GLOM|nr:Ribophorin I [Rhizophagus irregularis]
MRSLYKFLYSFLAFIVLVTCLIYTASANVNAIISPPFNVPKNWKNTNMLRTIDLTSSIVRETTAVVAQNIHNESIGEYYYPIPKEWDEHLSFIEVKEKGTAQFFEVEKAEFNSLNKIQYYKISFNRRLDPEDKIKLTVTTAFTHVLTPYPKEIAQTGRQNILFRGNQYGNSAYHTAQQKTTVKLPSAVIISYSQPTGYITSNRNTLEYGLFDGKEPNSYEELKIHYEFQQSILTVKGLRRDLEISHWGGNLAIEEHFNLTQEGARLKDQFSRLEYHKNIYTRQNSVMTRELSLSLPAHASNVYYRDEIGNVSTSHLRYEQDKTVLEFKPRYPLFGGWNYTWYYGYNVPIGDFVKYHSESGRYIMNIPFINVLPRVTYDKVQVRIILPEGASNIKVETPFPVDKESHGVHKTYLDTIGRYLIVLDKFNVLNDHSKNFQISYTYNSFELLRKPLAVSVCLLGAFLLSMVYSRMEFGIGKSEKKS